MSSVHPTKYGPSAVPSPHRLDAGLIQFCDAIEEPASTPAQATAEQLDQLRDELFRREQAPPQELLTQGTPGGLRQKRL